MKYQKLIILAILIILSTSCKKTDQINESQSEYIEITTQQFTSNKMQIDTIHKVPFYEIVKATGTLTPLPTANAFVFSPVSGIVKDIHCYIGQTVQKGQKLIEIYGTDFIDLQKEYAISASSLKKLTAEYERLQILHSQKAISDKEFLAVEADYKTTLATYNALKLKLLTLGLSPENIENGKFYTSYILTAPISGVISKLNAYIGLRVSDNTDLLQIVNISNLQARLAIFAKDISKIKVGQDVRLKLTNSDTIFIGKVTSIGADIGDDNISIPCFVSLPNNRNNTFVANSYIEAEIIISIDYLWAVPNTAIIKSTNNQYILVLHHVDSSKYYFIKHPVSLGKQNNSFVEIKQPPMNQQILTAGGYTIEIND